MKNFYKKTLAWAIISFLIISNSFAYNLSSSEMKKWDNITTKLVEIIDSKPASYQTKFKTQIINALNSLKAKMNENEKIVALISYVVNSVTEQYSSSTNIVVPANANGEIPYSNCTNAGQTYTADSTYSDIVAWTCDTPDKIVCTRKGYAQIWSMCNVWSSTSWLSSSSYGWYYQWWNNWDLSFSPGSYTKPIACSSINDSSYNSTANFIYDMSFDGENWCSGSQNNNQWGNITDTPVSGKSTNPSARKWPCATWYHVPSAIQWQYVYNNWFPNIQTILALPLAWYKSRYNGIMSRQDRLGGYWSSTSNGKKAYELTFTSSSITPADTEFFTTGLSVRCIKD